MVKSIVVTVIFLSGCVVDSSEGLTESNSNGLVICAKVNGEYPCCDDEEDACRHEYNFVIGSYLNWDAHSNGSCTGGGSGAYQCAIFAQNLWANKLKYSFTKRWIVAARALQCASTEEGLFVFRNGSSEPPRETDILVYLNVGQNEPANCNGNLLNNELNAL